MREEPDSYVIEQDLPGVNEPGGPPVRTHEDLEVYRLAFEAAKSIFELSKKFPPEERYSLTDQIRRSSRSVCANLAEAWRKRRYQAAFLSKLNDSEAEAAETQTWLRFAVESRYVAGDVVRPLLVAYDNILGKLVQMIVNPRPWLMTRQG
jgi:four helix bundle protein